MRDLPNGWEICKLSNCVEVLDSLRVPVNSDERLRRQGNIPYYGATGRVGWIDNYLFDEELLLIGEDGAPFFDKSKPIAYIIRGKSWVNNHAHVLRANYEITTNQYLKHFFDWFNFHGYVNGTTRLKLTQGKMNQIPILIPSLNEQRRIVAKLEKLLHRVDACKERLEKIPAILKRFRHSVLFAACSGRLTADWREKNAVIKSSLALLDQMNGDNTENYRCEGTYDIPVDWVWVRFQALVASIRGGSTVPPQNEPTDYSILRSSSVRQGFVDLEDVRFLRGEESQNSDNFICEGDLLFTRLSGSLEYVANCALVYNLRGRQIQYPDRLFCAKLKTPEMAPYVELCFGNPMLRAEITENAKSSAGHQRVSISDITGQRIPLPPLPEQHEIVRRVEALFKKADEIEVRYKKAKVFVDKLTQSILAKAFRGELVPQDPNDEPALFLLEKIRAEKLKHVPNKRENVKIRKTETKEV